MDNNFQIPPLHTFTSNIHFLWFLAFYHRWIFHPIFEITPSFLARSHLFHYYSYNAHMLVSPILNKSSLLNPPALPHYSYSLCRKAACKYCQTLSNFFFYSLSIYYSLDFTLTTLLKLLTFLLLMSLNNAQSFSAALGTVEHSFLFDWHSHLDAKKSLFPLSSHLTAWPCSLSFVGSSAYHLPS